MKKNVCKKIICILLTALTLCSLFIMPSSANGDEKVARLYIFSCVTSKAATGHSWIYVENLTDYTLTVGIYQLPAGQSVSVSTGKLRRADGAGIYYNVDSYLVNRGSGANRRSMQMEITAAQLERVSNTINSNNRWSIAFNCSNFAEKVWNSAGGTKVYSLGTPSFLKTWIGLKPHKVNVPMADVSPSQCYKQKGDSLVVCSSGSLTKPF